MPDNKLQTLVQDSGIESPTGAILYGKEGVLGSYGVAQLEDYTDLKDLKLTKDGYGLYSLNGHRVLISAKGDDVLAVYTKA